MQNSKNCGVAFCAFVVYNFHKVRNIGKGERLWRKRN